MVARFQDVIVRSAFNKIVVYSKGQRYVFANRDENGDLLNVRQLVSRFIDGLDDCSAPTLIPDKSTPIRPDCDGNNYGYGPSDEEAWLSEDFYDYGILF